MEYKTKVKSLKQSPDIEYIIIRFLQRAPWINMPWDTVTVTHIAENGDMRLRTVKGATLHRQFDIIRHAATVGQDEWGWYVDAEMIKKIKTRSTHPLTTSVCQTKIYNGYLMPLTVTSRQRGLCL